MIIDLYSRKVVAYQVYDCESGEMASDLVTDACLREKIARDQVTLHSDNGSPMKSVTMLAKLKELGGVPIIQQALCQQRQSFFRVVYREAV